MSRWPLLPLGLLLACAEEAPPRDLAVADPGEDDGSTVEPWEPPGGDDSAAPALQPTADCGGAASPLDDPAALPLDYCVRISPEPGEDWIAGGADTSADTGGPVPVLSGAPPPPPCGYTNLVGAARIGEGLDPVVLYCDADVDGGLRLARYDAAAGGVHTELVELGQCVSDIDTGALQAGPEGGRAYWVALDVNIEEGDNVDPGLLTVGVSAEGAATGPATRVLFPGWPVAVDWPGGGLLLIEDNDNLLWSLPVNADGVAIGEPIALAEAVRTLASASTADGTFVAIGGLDGSLTLQRLDAQGAPVASWPLSGADLAFDARPSLAVVGDVAVVAWADSERGYLSWVTQSTGAVTVTELGLDAIAPAVVADGDSLLSLDGTGRLARWALDGSLLGEALHPTVAVRDGYLLGLRLRIVDETLSVLLIGYDSVPVGGGHIYTFHYVEESRSPVPTP